MKKIKLFLFLLILFGSYIFSASSVQAIDDGAIFNSTKTSDSCFYFSKGNCEAQSSYQFRSAYTPYYSADKTRCSANLTCCKVWKNDQFKGNGLFDAEITTTYYWQLENSKECAPKWDKPETANGTHQWGFETKETLDKCVDADKTDCCCPGTAQDVTTPQPRFKLPDYTFQIPIGNLSTLTTVDCTNGSCSIPFISQYILAIYNYGLTAAAVIAILILMAAGLLWIVSGGDSGKITKAKQMIFGSVTGLLLLVSLNLFLTFINPDLTKLKPITIDYIKEINLINPAELQGCEPPYNKNTISGKPFDPTIISSIKKIAASNKIDPCFYAAVLSQESGGDPNSFADDRQVLNCGIKARRLYICTINTNCCNLDKAGCDSSSLCSSIAHDKKQVPQKDITKLDLSGAATYGFGLGQITYQGPKATPLCDSNQGFYYLANHKTCYHFKDLLTVDYNLQAMSDGILGYYCLQAANGGQPNLDCFKKYAGQGAWAECTGGKKMAVYDRCKADGFDKFAASSWTIVQK